MAVFALASTECLRDESIEAEENTESEEGDRREDIGTERDRSDGDGAVWQVAHHDCVHDGHSHPAKLGKDKRDGEANRWAKFVAEMGEQGHGRNEVKRVYVEEIRWSKWGMGAG